MLMVTIRITQLRQADLNLLVYFIVLAEERNISRAAKRLLLSQPAVSRALQRLRDLFQDDLLVRTPEGYEPTPKGQNLLQELAVIFPRIDRLISGSEFDPQREKASFRIAATDNATQLYGPVLCRKALSWGETSFEFKPWTDEAYEELNRGRLDLVLNADDGSLPPHFLREMLFEDEFVCVVAKESRFRKQISWKQYIAGTHVGVSTLGGRQTIPESALASHGVARRCVVSVPYFSVALHMVAGTELIVTAPQRLAESRIDRSTAKILQPPGEIGRFQYLMAWHKRLDTDAAHRWMRHTIREATTSIPPLKERTR
jgi:DNA-binding transcriptional LysR family regulator